MSSINDWNNLKFDCFYGDELVSQVVVAGGKVKIKRLTTHPVKQLFFTDEMDIFHLAEILKTRLWQQNYAGIDKVLNKLGLKHYDILSMIKKTHGVSYNDFFWIKFEGENLTWNDIKPKIEFYSKA